MGRSRTSSYIVEYRLAFKDDNPMSVLQKLDRIAAAIYNDVLNEGLKRMHRLELDRTYQETLVLYKRLLAKEKRDRKLSKADQKLKTQFSDYLRDADKDYGFTEYSLHAYVAKPKHYFHDVLGINECQKLATRAYNALWKLHAGKLRIIERKMGRSKRSTNPQNYNRNGTVRKGHLKWKFSRSYRKLKAQRADIYRRMAAKRKASHEQLANEIIASGTDIRVEKMQFNGLQRRAKKTTKNRNGRCSSKKRFGKTIGERAPAMLLSIIDRKLKYYGMELKKVDTARVRASQYNPLDESFHRKDLKDRMIELAPGIIVQRDMLSAYILEHTNSDLKSINRISCREDFNRFLDLQNKEITRLKENGQLSWYLR